jgi:hypothetical protein
MASSRYYTVVTTAEVVNCILEQTSDFALDATRRGRSFGFVTSVAA